MSLEPISKMGAQHRGRRGARQARRDDREYREYLRKEQRRLAGCIAGRMPSPFLRWVLAAHRLPAAMLTRSERLHDIGVSARADRRLERAIVMAIVALVILARSAIFVFWEQAHFDSDQAIVGLMAKHLSEGRAFPLFMYGSNYVLAIEAWMAAA